MPPLTEQQRRAIDTRHVPVVLSAGAGCGKTLVLTERFLSHLDPAYANGGRPSDWHKLVAITFTERAAREMRDRIRRRCHERLLQATGKESDIWWALLRDIDAARVTTIHSFCGELLRSHAVEAALDPDFQQLDEAAAETLLLEVIDQQLLRHLQQRHETVIELVAAFDVDGLRERVLTLIAQRGKHDFKKWGEKTPEDLLSAWRQYRDRTVLPRIIDDLSKKQWLKRLLKLLEANRHAGNETMQQRTAVLCDLLPKLINRTINFEDLEWLRQNATVAGAGNRNAWTSPEDYEDVKRFFFRLRDKQNGVIPFIQGLRQIAATETALDAAKLTHDVFWFTLQVLDAYELRKSQIPALDFDDLILRARDLLRDNVALRQRLAGQIDLLLVDEFQDTDSVQLDLVRYLCNEDLERGRLFVVGDLKQSIYRFRGAEPEVFARLWQDVPRDGRLLLNKNFRSQPSILHFVNALFCEAFASEQQPFERLEAHRPEATNNPKIEFLFALPDAQENQNDASAGKQSQQHGDSQPKGTEKNKDNVEQLRRREADWIARRLKTMIEQGEQLVGCGDANNPTATRPVRPGDIVILFRAMSNVAYYEEALRRHGIGYYLVGGRAFFAQQEVYDLLHLLRAVNSPADELSLLGALRSPIFSLDDETIFWLSQNPSNSLAAGLFGENLPEPLDQATQERVRFAAETIRELRELKDRLPVAELIQQALDRTGYDAALLAEFLGTRKLANLNKLIESARKFDRDGLFGLADFVTKLSHDVTHEPREELAALEAEDADVVRLMSVHQAKGLEFPVVVVADINRQDHGSHPNAAFDAEAGPMIRMPSKPWANDDPGGLVLWKAVSALDDEEELLRLFYVATTRAADYLILSAGVSELDNPKGRWLRLLAERFDLAKGELLATLPPDYVVPPIRVTTQRPSPAGNAPSQPARQSPKQVVEQVVELTSNRDPQSLPQPEDLSPLPPKVSARRQFSVSSLSGQIEETGPNEPQPTQANVLSPAGFGEHDNQKALLLGTLVHDLLADALAASRDGQPGEIADDSILEELAHCRAADRGMLDPPIEEACEMVRQFLDSDRAMCIRQAEQVHVEMEYLLRWPPDAQNDDAPFLRGYIDCLYRDDAGWHLLDYKTNRVDDDTLAEVAAHYELQMFVYAMAVEQCLGEAPVEIVLHFLREGLEHQFTFPEHDQRRLMHIVQQSMQQQTAAHAEPHAI